MRLHAALVAFAVATSAVPALAHPSHIGVDAGHSHWPAIALVVAAVALAGLPAVIRRRRARRLSPRALSPA